MLRYVHQLLCAMSCMLLLLHVSFVEYAPRMPYNILTDQPHCIVYILVNTLVLPPKGR